MSLLIAWTMQKVFWISLFVKHHSILGAGLVVWLDQTQMALHQQQFIVYTYTVAGATIW